ncbi:MAG TPA: glycosyltransferase [Nitrososphaerales archaeon]|nr:glycosyltransferase [Nitrososphaerales archaeon]HUK75393.1 glycosyltransferase [Nitrososphaerales archaeon]
MAQDTPRRLVSVIIPTRNRNDKLVRCLESVFASDYPDLEAVVVDDASTEPVEAALSGRFPKARFLRNAKRELMSCSRNSGARASVGQYLFFLDDDNVLAPDAIRLMVDTLDARPQVAVVSPIVFYLARPQTVWTSYIARSKLPGFYTLHTDIPPSEAPTFSFHNSFMVKRDAFESFGGFDCENFPMRFSEVDFAHKLSRAGYLAVVNPLAKDWHDLGWSLVHIDSKRAYYTERNRIIVLKRYYSRSDLAFYSVCVLPFVGAYYLLHHPLSSSDGRLKTASSFLRGTLDGLRFKA